MRVLHTANELDAYLGGRGWRSGAGPVIVPTMGALHAGHQRLIERGAAIAGHRSLDLGCVVWIFVNPTQFTDPRDLERYPRTLEQDMALCERAGASAVFAPAIDVIYPRGQSVLVPSLPEVATAPGLEDAHRPGHFAGVCQVVKRFFELMRPAVAVFGEKDWQQLQVIRALVRTTGMGVEIEAAPTVREIDGLAMSSRNRFLGGERPRAVALFEALTQACLVSTVGEAEATMAAILGGVDGLDYAVVRDADTLGRVPSGEYRGQGAARRRALIAAKVGGVRLIDNCDWEAGPG